ncbi:hypothetical protein ACFV3N_01310 [Streptomyces bauhiniae]|uniref:hypothetical protein n=1 Tax=Streptomyces bauhiniae TaxID=2340725 RepID=UPI00364A47B9
MSRAAALNAVRAVPGSARVLPVPLPGAGPASEEAQARRLGTALAEAAVPDGERAARETVAEVPAWTWDHVTGPVLDALGPVRPAGGRCPAEAAVVAGRSAYRPAAARGRRRR